MIDLTRHLNTLLIIRSLLQKA